MRRTERLQACARVFIYVLQLHRVGKYCDIFENIRFFKYFLYFRYISSICTYMVLTVSAAVLLMSQLGS